MRDRGQGSRWSSSWRAMRSAMSLTDSASCPSSPPWWRPSRTRAPVLPRPISRVAAISSDSGRVIRRDSKPPPSTAPGTSCRGRPAPRWGGTGASPRYRPRRAPTKPSRTSSEWLGPRHVGPCAQQWPSRFIGEHDARFERRGGLTSQLGSRRGVAPALGEALRREGAGALDLHPEGASLRGEALSTSELIATLARMVSAIHPNSWWCRRRSRQRLMNRPGRTCSPLRARCG